MKLRCTAIVTFDADVDEEDLYAAQRRLAGDQLSGFLDMQHRGNQKIITVDFMKIQEGFRSREPLPDRAPSLPQE